jgi:hypothetical protein
MAEVFARNRDSDRESEPSLGRYSGSHYIMSSARDPLAVVTAQ